METTARIEYTKDARNGIVMFQRGDRVCWAPEFLAKGKLIDPLWHEEQKDARGTVNYVQRDGDVLVLWDGDATTCVHPPEWLQNLTRAIPKGEWGWAHMHRTAHPASVFSGGES
jgi:hypothetical protein